MAASVSRSSSSTAVTKNCPQRSLAPSSMASTGAMSPCPSAAWLIAAIKRLRSRALTVRKIDLFAAPSALRLCASLAKRALARTTAPARSTVAIAIGVWSKKRMKRTSAARSGSECSSRARLITSVRDAPGTPSAPNASL